MIGDYDTGGLKELMKGLCDPNGRDGSSPNTFHFNWTQSLDADKVAAGTVTITGGDGDPAHEQRLIQSINTALLKTLKCTKKPTEIMKPGTKKREALIDPTINPDWETIDMYVTKDSLKDTILTRPQTSMPYDRILSSNALQFNRCRSTGVTSQKEMVTDKKSPGCYVVTEGSIDFPRLFTTAVKC